ncbi:hypothetical protein LCGC14_2074250 [marine sediment metagenome]|uniref:HEAT repeat domain-containing protein n=1 Tax=marine sediment metagenome TaxID=412755 RepID=A0A0F9EHC4_9ZZZZ
MTVNEVKVQFALGTLDIDGLIDMLKPLPGYWEGIIDNNTSKELLIYLSSNKHSLVRYYVAGNSNTPVKVLEKLSRDENWCVRCEAGVSIRSLEKGAQ